MVGVLYGSDTGNTEIYAKFICSVLSEKTGSVIDPINIDSIDAKDMLEYDVLLLGAPTWYFGELQSDWDDIYLEMNDIDLTGKLVAIFGCGDQVAYSEYFLDAIGIIGRKVEEKGGLLIGETDTDGYLYEKSQALTSDQKFMGLGIDVENQDDLSESRILEWLDQLNKEIGLYSM